MIFIILLNIEVYRTLAFISISVIQDFLYQINLFDNMTGSMWFDAGRQYVQCVHRLMIPVQIILNHFHRLQLFQACFLSDLVFSTVGIMLQVTNIRNITYITYFISQMFQIPKQDIKRNRRTRMSEMRISIDRWSANIHTDKRFVQRNKLFLSTGQRVVNIAKVIFIISFPPER